MDDVEYKEPTESPLFTEEIRRQLIGLLPFDSGALDKYTPSAFKNVPEEFRPVYVLRPLKQVEREQMSTFINQLTAIEKDGVTDDTEKEVSVLNDKMNDLVRKCIVSMKNQYDLGTGRIIKYEAHAGGGLSKLIWAEIPESIKTNIYYRLNGLSGLFYTEVVSLKS